MLNLPPRMMIRLGFSILGLFNYNGFFSSLSSFFSYGTMYEIYDIFSQPLPSFLLRKGVLSDLYNYVFLS